MPEANTRLREIDFVELVESSSGHGIAAQARRRLVVDAKMDWFRLRGYLAVLAAVLWSSGSRSRQRVIPNHRRSLHSLKKRLLRLRETSNEQMKTRGFDPTPSGASPEGSNWESAHLGSFRSRSEFCRKPCVPRKIQATASVPKKTVSIEGCTPGFCAHFAPKFFKLRIERVFNRENKNR
jgi:hypothetical protein